MKIALVHEFINQLGGAERTLLNFFEIWPDAVVHTVFYDAKKTENLFEPYKKKISFLDSMPGAKAHPKLFLALIPKAIENFKFKDFDLVLSDSSSFAKGAKTQGKLHICYCHTPTRFLWTESEPYLKAQLYPFFLKWAGNTLLPLLRKWDYKAAQNVGFFIANSENVRKRIAKYYQRDSVVIPPPVDTEFFRPVGTKQKYFLVASRLEPYKNIELAIDAFNELGLPLKVIGTGTNLVKLKAMAKPNIEFLGRVSDEELRKHYSEAQAYVFPAEEDAGITVVEAQACGTPVIAYGAGGSLETIKEGVTGEFFWGQTVDSLKAAIQNFNPQKYDAQAIRAHAEQYDKLIFQKRIKEFVTEKYEEFKK